MNHKRKRPKNRRAGCLMCKGHKANGVKGTFDAQTRQEKKAIMADREERIPSSKKYKKRTYAIEHRTLFSWQSDTASDWGVWGRYATEKARDEALNSLSKKEENRAFGHRYFEFRKGTP